MWIFQTSLFAMFFVFREKVELRLALQTWNLGDAGVWNETHMGLPDQRAFYFKLVNSSHEPKIMAKTKGLH